MSEAKLREQNARLVKRVLGDFKCPTGDGLHYAESYGATDLNALLDAARAEGSEMVVKIMSGPYAGELWLVGSGFHDEFGVCGEKLND